MTSIDLHTHHTGTPPALYEKHVLGDVTLETGEQLTLYCGLDQDMAATLIEHANDMSDEALQRHTNDRERFADRAAYEAWYTQKTRFAFPLVDEAGTLAALVWYGEGPLPGARQDTDEHWDTIAFRSYPPFRGMGIMGALSRAIIAMHEAVRPDHQLWLSVMPENEAGKALYAKLGFVETGTKDKRGATVFVRHT